MGAPSPAIIDRHNVVMVKYSEILSSIMHELVNNAIYNHVVKTNNI